MTIGHRRDHKEKIQAGEEEEKVRDFQHQQHCGQSRDTDIGWESYVEVSHG